MNNPEKQPLITPRTRDALIRAFLRSLSVIIPGVSIYELIEDLKHSRTSIDEKIRRTSAALQETSNLISELEESLQERTRKLNLLKQEIERYSQMAEVEESKAKALLQQIEITINKGKNIERWISFAINIIAGIILFILGVVLSPYINSLLGIGQ